MVVPDELAQVIPVPLDEWSPLAARYGVQLMQPARPGDDRPGPVSVGAGWRSAPAVGLALVIWVAAFAASRGRMAEPGRGRQG